MRFSNRDLKNMIVPLFGEQLLVLLVGIADTLIVSYTGEAAVSGVSLVNMVIQLVFIHNLFNAVAFPFSGAMSSGLRAAGDVKFTTVVSIGSTTAGRLTLSYLLGSVCNLGVIGIALAMCCDWTIQAILYIRRLRSGKWKQFKVVS